MVNPCRDQSEPVAHPYKTAKCDVPVCQDGILVASGEPIRNILCETEGDTVVGGFYHWLRTEVRRRGS